ncbi:sensor histidine kinase [Anaerotruncus rubiinfantis]|jgi:signal transduction histidine kinase|uniref:sensor histidine kinase n=1 Tax=Anaerotruncus rubiinfantis TaxID=1720200 RepID=UPI000833A490|nr:HAMP domain-containing sensor histidine kinase [Anaerotruncus rubiinfantis]
MDTSLQNDQFLDRLVQMASTAGLPYVFTDENFNIIWSSEAARTSQPCLSLPDGVHVLLDGYDFDQIRGEIDAHGVFSTVNDAMFLQRSVTVLPLPDQSGHARYLVQPSFFTRQGTGLHPEGTALALSAFGSQYRVPLTAIFSSLSLLRQNAEQQDEQQRAKSLEYLQSINQNAYLILRACDWMTTYTRLSQGLWPSLPRRVEIFGYLRELFEAAARISESAGIPLTFSIPTEPLVISCDLAKLSMAIHNILSNSMRYTRPDNVIEVKVRKIRSYVSVSIVDRGRGIPAKVQPHVFQPYYSFDPSGQPFTGNGLGLAIAKSCVAALGGTITLISEENKGTTVLFTIDAKDDPSAPEAVESTAAEYLSDRFSTLRIALCDAAVPPLR